MTDPATKGIHREARTIIAGAFYLLVAGLFLATLLDASDLIEPGVSELYNRLGPAIAPNMVTVVLFDWRAFDTLGEAIILVSGVIATALIFGRGQLFAPMADEKKKAAEDEAPSTILDVTTPALVLLLIALGVYVTLGGHITPGGGFQGGSIIAAATLLSLAVYGRKSIMRFGHRFLTTLESVGLLAYLFIGLLGLFYGGSYLYNVGTNLYALAPTGIATLLNYPDATGAGIIPYLNIAIFLKVSAGLSTLLLVLLGVEE